MNFKPNEGPLTSRRCFCFYPTHWRRSAGLLPHLQVSTLDSDRQINVCMTARREVTVSRQHWRIEDEVLLLVFKILETQAARGWGGVAGAVVGLMHNTSSKHHTPAPPCWHSITQRHCSDPITPLSPPLKGVKLGEPTRTPHRQCVFGSRFSLIIYTLTRWVLLMFLFEGICYSTFCAENSNNTPAPCFYKAEHRA